MNLGILYKSGVIVNHRSFVKVIFNPIFRYFGFHLATKTKTPTEIVGVKFCKCERVKSIKWDFGNHHEFDYISKRRMFI